MEMPSVLMVGPDIQAQGGMATVENNILQAVRDRGDKADFVPTYVEGGKVRKLAVAARAYLIYLDLLRKCDLVHVHMASRGSYARKKVFMEAAFKRHVPVVLHLHGSEFALWFESECSESKRDDIRNTLGCCAKVVVLSEEWRQFFLANEICEPEKLAVIHNAVYVPDENTTEYDTNGVLFLGRLGERKSPETLLRAARVVLEGHPEAHFEFGGDGDVEGYENLARELGVGESCRFVGWVTGEQKESLFLKNSIYCLPSKNEGMPMSVLEAMAHGLTTVATPVGGVPQVIEDGVDGVIVPVGDDVRLAEALTSLMDDRELKERLGRAGRARIEERFSMGSYLDKVLRIYEEVLK